MKKRNLIEIMTIRVVVDKKYIKFIEIHNYIDTILGSNK